MPNSKSNSLVIPFAVSPRSEYTYARQLASISTIFPLFGVRKTAAATNAAALHLIIAWRIRIRRLGDRGWDMVGTRKSWRGGGESNSRKWRMINCPPAAIMTEQQAIPCSVATICPHCWARWAIAEWRVVDRALFGEPLAPDEMDKNRRDRVLAVKPVPMRVEPTTPYAVVDRTIVYDIPRVQDGKCALKLFLQHRTRRTPLPGFFKTAGVPTRTADIRSLNRAGAVGGFETIQTGLLRDPTDRSRVAGWRVRVRQVILVPNAAAASFCAKPAVLATPAGTVSLKTHNTPTRKRVMQSMATACQYPAHLLRGPYRHTFSALNARRGLRLSTRFGLLYGNNTTDHSK